MGISWMFVPFLSLSRRGKLFPDLKKLRPRNALSPGVSNYDPWAKSFPLPVFLKFYWNTVVPICLQSRLFSCYNSRAEWLQQSHMACTVHTYSLALSKKSLPTLNLIQSPHFTVEETLASEVRRKSSGPQGVPGGRDGTRLYFHGCLASFYWQTALSPFLLGAQIRYWKGNSNWYRNVPDFYQLQ